MNILKIRSEMKKGKSLFDLPLRVTFYARVSTDKDEQRNSLENQVQYYRELIQSKPNWTFVEGYVDDTVIMGLNQNPVQTGVDLVPFFFLSALFSANEGVSA